jgi:N-methylhydantoinase B
MVAIHDDRWFTKPWGVNGGRPGARARKILEEADGTTRIVANKLENLSVKTGDRLHFITWGGGGWGNPLQRDPALVAKEIAQGLVSVEGARDYGVVIVDGAVDEAATAKLRADMAAEARNEVFDFGGEIESLRASCETETGLPAPQQPVWATAVAAE